MDVFAENQIKIAKDTLKMSDVGARIMGGMAKDEARAILARHGIANTFEPMPADGTAQRAAHDTAYADKTTTPDFRGRPAW